MKQQKLLVSIIVPVYNAEKFIDRTVNSIACQLTEETELLLVDDGSADNSGKLCDEYAKTNPFIRVIHKENGGSSSARNAGLLAARGEYISFTDADDYVDAGAYCQIIEVIQQYHPDCIEFGWKYISRDGNTYSNGNQIPKDELLGQDVIKDRIIPTLINLSKDKSYFIYDFVWNKLYRRDKIISFGIQFSETRRTWEDRLFVLEYLRHCENYYSMSRCFYNYVDVPNSKSQRFNVDRLRIILENYRLYQEMFGKDYDFDTEYANNYWAELMEKMILQSLSQPDQKGMIVTAVSAVLQEDVVKHWFAKRNSENAFEKKVSALIFSGETEQAIRCFKARNARERRKRLVQNVEARFISVLRKLTGK